MREFFRLKYHNTTYAAEIRNGLSVYLCIAYILVVNPTILSGCGMDYFGVFIATIITGVISTLIMAVYTKLPIALVPGLSVNALFVSVTMVYFGGDYHITLLATYLSGVLFIFLISIGVFEKIDKKIPDCVKYSVLAGLGLALIKSGLKSVDFFRNPVSMEVGLTLLGVLLIACFMLKRMKGAVIYGILITCFASYVITSGMKDWDFMDGLKELPVLYESFEWNWDSFFENCFHFPSIQIFLDSPFLLLDLMIVSVIFTIIHFADGVGTASSLLSLMEAEGRDRTEYKGKAMQVNGLASIVSGLMGTSTVTIYAESAVGIMQGAKTGVAGLTVCVLLLFTGFLAPILKNLSVFVTAQTVIVAGMLSMYSLTKLKSRPKFEIVIAMIATLYIGLTFNIAQGFIWSLCAYVLYHIIKGEEKRYKWILACIGIAMTGIGVILFQNNLA